MLGLETLISFDKASYRTGETMAIRFEVVNLGSEVVRDVHVLEHLHDENRIITDYESWGALRDGGVDLAAGGDFTVTVTGRAPRPGATTGVLSGYLYQPSEVDVVEFDHAVPVTPTFGRAGGLAYGDENGNARFDAGEGLAGVEVTLENAYVVGDTYTTTSGADGSFSFPRLPTVLMGLSAVAPGDWRIGYRNVMIDEANSNDDLLLRGVGALTGLTASLEFTKNVYRVGEQAKVRVRLTNRTNRDLIGIVANCNRAGNTNALTGRTPGWGALAGDGVTIRARRTLDLTVTEAVPQAAFDHGTLTVACDFSYSGIDDENSPSDHDLARVPGGLGTVEGDVNDYTGGDPVGVADVRLVLVTDARCPILGETRTGQDGRFTFTRVPTGEHRLYLFTPKGWRVSHDNPTSLDVMADQTSRLVLEVTPGSATPPTLPTQPKDCAAPAPQARTAPAAGLADTGTDLGVLLVIGLGSLTAGVAGVGLSRRRPRKVTATSR